MPGSALAQQLPQMPGAAAVELVERRRLLHDDSANPASDSESEDETTAARTDKGLPAAPDAAALAQFQAITALWFAKGCADAVPTVALRQFILIELRASPATQAVLYGVVYAIPWNLKFGAAFISDTVPICGRRRRPYLLRGTLFNRPNPSNCPCFWV